MKTLFFTFLILSILILVINVDLLNAQAGETKPEELFHPELYPLSPFNEAIPADPEIDENSALVVENIVELNEDRGFVIALKDFAIPVFYANTSTPHHDVTLTANWAPAATIKDVPIPDFAEWDPGIDDRHMVVIDLSTGCEYDFWRTEQDDNGKWEAAWVNAISIDGDGIFPKGLSARGSGFALPMGIIWPDELEQGIINHALELSLDDPFVKTGGPVPPATESDGISRKEFAIPEGARLQLDPDLDLDSLNLTSYEKTIAKAMQVYGMFLVDRSEELEIQAVNPISVQGDPYDGILPDEKWVDINIPVDKFRVLKLEPQFEDDTELVLNECADFLDDDGTIINPDDNGEDDDDDDGDKSFTFNCEHSMKRVPIFGLEKLTMNVGDAENCTLKLTNHELDKTVKIETNLRAWFGSAVEVDPLSGITDENGELEFTITALDKGINWAAWAVPNENGKFTFSRKTYDTGLAWGMFVMVE